MTNKTLKRFNLGLTGMIEDPHGQYVLVSTYNEAIREWQTASHENRELAEGIMKSQDAEIAEKNKEILALKKLLVESEGRVAALNNLIGDSDE